MPSDNTYNNATSTAASEQSPDPRTYQLAGGDAFHHRPQAAAVASPAESLPCPRCESKNTKFCYYNNYNLSQPRHFCKACRRYWTHGGTLRNVPFGGGTRKSASVSRHSSSSSNKRPRSSPVTVSSCSSSSPMSGHDVAPSTKPPAAPSITATGVTTTAGGGPRPGFTSQLSAPGSNTFLALGGYGPAYMPALDGLGFGFGRGVWPPFAEAGFVEGGGYGGFHGPMVCPVGVDAWHVGPGGGGGGEGGGGGGFMDEEGFAWPELAISMPGQEGLK